MRNYMISSTEACHETLQLFTKFAYYCGVGERAVSRFVGFEATGFYSNRKEHYNELLYESELPAPNSFCCRSFLVRKIWVIQNSEVEIFIM